MTVPPDAIDGRSRLSQQSITFCTDTRKPYWQVGEDISQAVADALLLEHHTYRIDPTFTEEITSDWYYILLADHCDAILDLPLGANAAYPDFMIFTRSYMVGRYVLASRKQFGDLQDVIRAEGEKVGLVASSVANFELSYYLTEFDISLRRRVYPTDEALLRGLMNDEVSVALIWEPSLVALLEGDPADAGFYTASTEPLQNTSWGIGMGLMAQNTFLRSLLDDAIEALLQEGVIQNLLAERHLPTALDR